MRPAATLIGDLVGSRLHSDRSLLHQRLRHALARANSALNPVQPLEVTVGDEFQGCFATVGEAARASVVIRLLLVNDEHGTDSRYGLGWGTIAVFDEARAPVSQDGPGWWAARAAIDRAAALGKVPRTSFVRTCFTTTPDDDGQVPCDAAIDAFLLCRDASVGQMTDRQREILLGVLLGHSQRDLADREGITQGAVSQTLSRSGGTAIELAHRRLEEMLP